MTSLISSHATISEKMLPYRHGRGEKIEIQHTKLALVIFFAATVI